MNTASTSHRFPGEESALRRIGRFFYFAALPGLAVFGTYILLRGTGATFQNFGQWQDLVVWSANAHLH